jgi:hypothetical protein
MAGNNNPALSSLEQIRGQVKQALRYGPEEPARRAKAKKVLTEAIGYIMGNQLDKFADIDAVQLLRENAESTRDLLETLGPDDNAKEANDEYYELWRRADRLADAAGNARRALPERLQPPRAVQAGKRKTRKGKSRSRRARYSRRR